MGVPNSKLSQKNINVTLIQIYLDTYSKIILSFNFNGDGDTLFFNIVCIVIDFFFRNYERVPPGRSLSRRIQIWMLYLNYLFLFMIFVRRTRFITISCAVNTNECDAGDVGHVHAHIRHVCLRTYVCMLDIL